MPSLSPETSARSVSAASAGSSTPDNIALPAPAVFTDEQLRSINVPTLTLIAGRSVIHDAEAACRRARRPVPHVQAELWPDATNAISGEHAVRVNRTVLAFIDHVDRGAGSRAPT